MTTSSDVISPSATAEGSIEPRDNIVRFLIAGVIFLAASAALLLIGNEADPARPFLGWLLGTSFWASILIGMLFLTMIGWMFDAGWSIVVRRQMENALGGFGIIGIVLLPLLVISMLQAGSGAVAWIWMNPEAHVVGGHGTVSHDVLYISKSAFLNQGFFALRFFAYFLVWIGLSSCFRSWSAQMDETGDHKFIHRSRKLAAVGLFLCAFATTFAAIDWFKSLNYHWFSTMYGVWFFAACIRAALSAIVLILLFRAGQSNGLKGIIKPAHFYLLGCLMLAFTVFWAYISFSQYFLIYNANIPEETFWYNMREMAADGSKNSWWWVSLTLIFFHFFFPFLYLLWYKNKYNGRIKFIAIWILIFHLLDLYWNIIPQKLPADNVMGYETRPFSIEIIDVTTFLGVGSLVIWVFLKNCKKFRPIPIRDPRINESLHCHE